MGHIFIAYAPSDGSVLAANLRRDLEAAGYTVWQDRRDIDPEGYFDAATERAAREAQTVLALLSPDLARPDHPVQLEIIHARAAGVPVVPLLLPGGVVPVTLRGTRQTTCDLYEPCLADVLDRLRAPRETPVLASRREREIAYAQHMAEDFVRWTLLEAGIPRWWEPPVPVRWATPKHLNPVYVIHREMGVAGGGETRQVDQADDLGRAVWVDRALLVGEAGAGKTITLRWLAYHFALTALDDEAAALPLIVPLAGFTGGDLGAYIEQHFAGLALVDYLPDRVLVMLDGITGLSDEQLNDVVAWVHVNRKTPLVITCRPLDVARLKGLPLRRIDLLSFDVHRVYRYLGLYLADSERDRFFWALAGPEMAELWGLWRQAGLHFADFWSGAALTSAHHVYYLTSAGQEAAYNEMRAALQAQGTLPGLLELVRKPLLLHMAAQVYSVSRTPPRDQEQLYSAYVSLLLTQHNPRAAVDAQKNALSALAAQAQAEGRGDLLPQSWVLETLRDHAADTAQEAGGAASLLGRAKRATLLVNAGQDTVRFRHVLLRDYFAARAISQAIQGDVPAAHYWPDGVWWERTGWEESALLLAGMHPAARGGAAAVAAWLAEAHPVLACRVLTEYQDGAAQTNLGRRVQVQLVTAMTGAAPAKARALTGQMLNRLGDPRPGVGLRADGLPDFNWAKVPGGSFLMGSDRQADEQAWENETPAHEAETPVFFVARYPVTNTQFQVFVEDEAGYNNPAWWTEAGREWKGERAGPELHDDPVFDLPNHPRVGVTWYEAVAFCHWASARLGYTIRLLSETEWEKTARGGEGRRFSYGDVFVADYANLDQTGLGYSSAVGVFPQDVSLHGVFDLSGNVREWCLSQWRGNYIAPENNDLAGAGWRVLRGGSWRSLQWASRCAARRGSAPYEQNAAVGFRVAAAAPV